MYRLTQHLLVFIEWAAMAVVGRQADKAGKPLAENGRINLKVTVLLEYSVVQINPTLVGSYRMGCNGRLWQARR